MLEKNSHGSMPLFLEDVFDALRAAVQAAGGAKTVAGRIWPHKPIDQARKELLDALNRDNARKLCVEEVIALLAMARESGYHQAKHWIDEAIGYQPTPPSDPKVERDRLADALEHAAQSFDALKQQATNLLEQDKRLKAVR
jgi:hypothetical protein